ncbi:Ig-like domain-containing protein [Thalassobellus citreus]|uniref:Ig-like domain-containing protein n=1 Tax=Thalassobellus citreus TaxID=3367752 RepID=UPI0037B6231F
MKNSFFYLFLFILIISCGGKDDASEIDDDPILIVDEITPQEGNTALEVIINLPEGSTQNLDNVEILSIFNTDTDYSNGVKVEVFETDELELVFATNNSNQLYMMGYVVPNKVDSLVLDSQSTALATILFHPWAFDLTSEDKLNAMEKLKTLPEFNEYLKLVEANITSGNQITVAGREKVIEAYIKEDSGKNSIVKKEDVIEIKVDETKVTVKKNNSAAHYGVGIYKKSNPDSPFNDRTVLSQNTETSEFAIPLDGEWDINVKNGLVFDGSVENQFALRSNSSIIIKSILNLYSGKLGNELLERGECTFDNFLAPALVPTANLYVSWQQFSKKEISDLELIKNVSLYAAGRENDFWTAINNCLVKDFGDSFGSEAWSKILKLLNFVNDAYDGYQVTKSLILNKNSVELCFVKNGTNISFCNGISLGGVFDFGKIPIGKSSEEKTLVVSNNLDIEVTVEGIELPIGFTTIPDFKTNEVIMPGQDLSVKLKYEPQNVAQIDTDIIIKNDADQENNKIKVLAAAVNPLNSDKTVLDFDSLLVDDSSTAQLINLTNDSDVDITLIEVAPIEGYEFSLPEQTIKAGQTISVSIKFTPTDDTENYNKQLILKTDTNQEDLIIELKGQVFKRLILEVLSEPKNLDFGEVATNSNTGKTKSLRITNPTDIPIFINYFEFTDETKDEGGYITSEDEKLSLKNGTPSGIELIAGGVLNFSITFKPDTERTYNGNFLVDYTESQDVPLSMTITGKGVVNELSVSETFLDFGEVEVGGIPSERTFVITNNLGEDATITMIPDDAEVKTNWPENTSIASGDSRTITATFTPTAEMNTTPLNGTIQIEYGNLGQPITVNYTGSKKEDNNDIDLPGIWYFNFDEDGLNSGICTSYAADGSIINVQNDAFVEFINSVRINSGGIFDPDENGVNQAVGETASFSVSNNNLSFEWQIKSDVWDIKHTFTGVWNESKKAFVGTASTVHKQFFVNLDMTYLQKECTGFSEYCEVSKSSYTLP